MDYKKKGTDIFLRLDPGDYLVKSLELMADDLAFNNAAIISGVGMVLNPEFGFFDAENDQFDISTLNGIFDLNSINGNITILDGKYVPHVHLVLNDEKFNAFGGHLIETTTHITMEIFLSTNPLMLERKKIVNCPATKIVI